MKTTLKVLAFSLAVCGAANGQVVPAATGPGSLPTGSNLQYALRYSEAGEFVTTLANMQTSTASGTLNYMNGSERAPFTMEYGGGYTWTLTGPSYETGQFHRLFLSQGIDRRTWKAMVNDEASYLPQSPTTGFSGIPGTGEPIGVTNPASPSTQTILTLNTHVVENNANGSLEHNLNPATTILLGGNSGLLRYPDGNGLDINSETATAAVERALNVRNSLMGSYFYSNFSYPAYNFTFQTNSGLFGFRHMWTRTLMTNIAAGPQWISGSSLANSTNNVSVPSSINVTASASINYLLRFNSADVSYTRGTNGGAGYLIGSEADSVAGNFSHQFGLNLSVGLTGGYERTAALNGSGTINAKYGGAQATWRMGRDFIVFGNYTGTAQSSTAALPANVLGQLMQVIGFGVGYSPRPNHLRQ